MPPDYFATTAAPFPQFSRLQASAGRSFDFSDYSRFLSIVVMDFGLSDRIAKRKAQDTGTRVEPGHNSRYRLEGNRIPFEVFDDNAKAVAARHRQALQTLGDASDLSSFTWLDQMAFWINLHNSIVIDEIARAYPKVRPEAIRPEDGDGAFLFDAKLVALQGVSLSLNDIRRDIVYRHWRTPLAMYGFFNGSIGGPSIQPRAYTAGNIQQLLSESAEEFVNSLRGVDAWGNTLKISSLYAEAQGLFPAWPDDLRTHRLQFAIEEVAEATQSTTQISATTRAPEIADFSGGEPYHRRGAKPPPPPSSILAPGQGGELQNRFSDLSRLLPDHGLRLLNEKQEKNYRLLLRSRRRREGTVIIEDLPTEPRR